MVHVAICSAIGLAVCLSLRRHYESDMFDGDEEKSASTRDLLEICGLFPKEYEGGREGWDFDENERNLLRFPNLF